MPTMQAAVVHTPGGPENLILESRPIPQPQPGWVRIRVRAFGLNRAEIHTRRGESPGVTFPRILGIEATGQIDAAPGGEFAEGDTVATVMGGMGRIFDGGYAEYTCVPAAQVRKLTTTLDWPRLAALPEMLQTAWGALHRSLQIQGGQTLLVRGGTSSVGLAATALARRAGLTVIATTRSAERAAFLKQHGAHHALVDSGNLTDAIRAIAPEGVDRALDLVGTATLADTLATLAHHGIACIAGGLAEQWSMANFSPIGTIQPATYLTSYGSRVDVMLSMPWEELLAEIQANHLRIPLGPVFPLHRIAEAHRCMEANTALGKIVVTT